MKIAFLNIYQSTVNRGAETFVAELSKRLRKKHQVDIFSSKIRVPKRWPVVWRAFLDPQSLSIGWFTLKQLPKIWKEKYDIVAPLNGGWQPAFVRIITWLYGGKMVIASQSGIGWDDRNNLWSFPDRFVAISSKALRWAKKHGPFVKSVYIPNGVDLKKFNPKGKKYETRLKKPIILCVGALTASKRIDLTIKAVAKLDDASLLVVGEGSMKEELNKLGKKLMGNRFELIKASFEKMPEIYRVADLFTLIPEGSEAFGIVYAEAMASNLPVVALDDEQRREIIADAGMFVNKPDSRKYVEILAKVLNKKWGNKPRQQARKFSWDEIAERYESLFKSLQR